MCLFTLFFSNIISDIYNYYYNPEGLEYIKFTSIIITIIVLISFIIGFLHFFGPLKNSDIVRHLFSSFEIISLLMQIYTFNIYPKQSVNP